MSVPWVGDMPPSREVPMGGLGQRKVLGVPEAPLLTCFCVLLLPGAGCTATSSLPASSHLAATTPSSRCDIPSAAVPPRSPCSTQHYGAHWMPVGLTGTLAIGQEGKPGWVLTAPQADPTISLSVPRMALSPCGRTAGTSVVGAG